MSVHATREMELARILAGAAYDRAAVSLVSGIEECSESYALEELQKIALMRAFLANFQNLEEEFQTLISSARSLNLSAIGTDPVDRFDVESEDPS